MDDQTAVRRARRKAGRQNPCRIEFDRRTPTLQDSGPGLLGGRRNASAAEQVQETLMLAVRQNRTWIRSDTKGVFSTFTRSVPVKEKPVSLVK